MKRGLRIAIAYGACCALALAALCGISFEVLESEGRETAVRVEARRQEVLYRALRQLDTWMAPLLAVEAQRAPDEYTLLYQESRNFDLGKNAYDNRGLLTRSPIAALDIDWIQVHFQVLPSGLLNSPQIAANATELQALVACTTEVEVTRRSALFARVQPLLSWGELYPRVRALSAGVLESVSKPASAAASQDVAQRQESLLNPAQAQIDDARDSFDQRARSTALTKFSQRAWIANSQQMDPAEWIGPLVALWRTRTPSPDLWILRLVRRNGMEILQGFAVDWALLQGRLAAEIADVAPGAELVPWAGDRPNDLELAGALTTLPISVAWNPPTPELAVSWTPGRIALASTWGAVLVSLVAGAWLIHASVTFGDQRARFASAVTHELRSPLTTFRLYTEMLAEGLVTDESKRTEYLRTLESESARLARLVENVLSYSRLEEGRAEVSRRPITAADLWSRIEVPIRRRAEQSHAELTVRGFEEAGPAMLLDAEAVGQVIFNLVDNACKYGSAGAPPAIEIELQRNAAEVTIRVSDGGPGVPLGLEHAIFEPFDRGGRKELGTATGVGLGLSIARGLARRMGGDLLLAPRGAQGASFLLRLPIG
ncbi:MAG: HAMP domain-containing histidine kinase [Planctomycetes bacterium]|nr:HAMP domain-containing histidine kinase [Planctomycetota bacterium]